MRKMAGVLGKIALGAGAASLLEKGVKELNYEALKEDPEKELKRVASIVGEYGRGGIEGALVNLANKVGATKFAHPSELIVEGYRPDELTLGMYRRKEDRPVTSIEAEQVNYLVEHIGEVLPKKYVPKSLNSKTKSKAKLVGQRLLVDIIGFAEPSPEALKKHLLRDLSTLNGYITRTMDGEDVGSPIEELKERRDMTEEEIGLIDRNTGKFEAVMGRWTKEWLTDRFQHQD